MKDEVGRGEPKVIVVLDHVRLNRLALAIDSNLFLQPVLP